MRAWTFITPEGRRSAPYPTRSKAVVEAIHLCVARFCARIGADVEVNRLPPEEAEATFRDIEPEGWKVEGMR